MEHWVCLESGADRVFAGLGEECEKMELSLTEMRKATGGASLREAGEMASSVLTLAV